MRDILACCKTVIQSWADAKSSASSDQCGWRARQPRCRERARGQIRIVYGVLRAGPAGRMHRGRVHRGKFKQNRQSEHTQRAYRVLCRLQMRAELPEASTHGASQHSQGAALRAMLTMQSVCC